jgi:hypothetical protein
MAAGIELYIWGGKTVPTGFAKPWKLVGFQYKNQNLKFEGKNENRSVFFGLAIGFQLVNFEWKPWKLVGFQYKNQNLKFEGKNENRSVFWFSNWFSTG